MFSKWKDRFFEAKIELAELRIEVKALNKQIEDSLLKTTWAESRIEELAVAKSALERDKAVLLERLDLIANHLPEPQAFSLSEDEEDARWALDRGVINQSQFESILEEAGAINTEIHFDAEDYPRLSAVK